MNKNHSIKTLFLAIVAILSFSLTTSCNKAGSGGNNLIYSLPDTLEFPVGDDVASIILKNISNEGFDFDIYTSSYNYISVSPSYGNLQPGGQVNIMVSIDREHLGNNEYLGFLINHEPHYVTIIAKCLNFSVTEELYFGIDSNSTTFSINNLGTANLHYLVEPTTDYVTIPSNNTGDINPGQQAFIKVEIDREAIIANQISPSINVTVNDSLLNIPIIIEEKLMLSKDIIDAEYSKANNLLVFIADDNTVNIFHPETESFDEIPLYFVPVSISLSPDGTKAAVGHDGYVSYVDLIAKEVVDTRDISCRASDIVMGSNGWAYAFPTTGYRIHCVDFTVPNSEETTSTGTSIYHNTKAKLHPSGKYIYGADNGLSPMDIEKYDIQEGTAAYLYDSPYHGTYPMGGDLWLTEDGGRVITLGGGVYKTSEVYGNDMIYNGRITLPDNNANCFLWIDHSEVNNEFYLIERPSYDAAKAPFIYIINSDNLIFKRTISLEKYQVTDYQGNTTLYEAEPYFAFANSDGNLLLVITKAVGSGLVHEWAIQRFDIGQ